MSDTEYKEALEAYGDFIHMEALLEKLKKYCMLELPSDVHKSLRIEVDRRLALSTYAKHKGWD